MKKYFIILMSVFMTSPIFAQSDISMLPIVKEAQEYIEAIEDQLDQEIVRVEFDIIFDTKESMRKLYSGNEYKIIAFGDYRVEDIDVAVYRRSGTSGWTLVDKDDDESDVAVASVTPNATDDYKVEIKVYKYKSGYSAAHYGLIISHQKN